MDPPSCTNLGDFFSVNLTIVFVYNVLNVTSRVVVFSSISLHNDAILVGWVDILPREKCC